MKVDANLTLDSMTVNGTTVTIDSAVGDSVIIGDTVKLSGGATLRGASSLLLGAITNTGTLEIVDTASLLNDVVTDHQRDRQHCQGRRRQGL